MKNAEKKTPKKKLAAFLDFGLINKAPAKFMKKIVHSLFPSCEKKCPPPFLLNNLGHERLFIQHGNGEPENCSVQLDLLGNIDKNRRGFC
jgi:hypothetical protein